MLTIGSLFAGIGGIDLGLERTGGFKTRFQVEIDDYANRVLEKHWPDVRRHRDIRTFPPEPIADWRVDVVVGGFPCQDISYAGRGAGLEGERSGLFYEAMRVVRILEPRIVVLENVAALLTRGMDTVLGTLASLGFDAEWHCIPAAAVGAPHIRDRVFVIAYAAGRGQSIMREPSREDRQFDGAGEAVPNTLRPECESGTGGRGVREGDTELADAEPVGRATGRRVEGDKESQGQRRDESSARSWWSVEPDVGRVAHGIPRRVDRLRCLGNAVVPQVAEFIGNHILSKKI